MHKRNTIDPSGTVVSFADLQERFDQLFKDGSVKKIKKTPCDCRVDLNGLIKKE